MNRFKLPLWVQKHDILHGDLEKIPKETFQDIRSNFKRLYADDPEVSIVIPAYNEEKNILKTLSSLSCLQSTYSVEILVVNNNSSDQTQEILDLCGVRWINEPRQGVSYARQAGLENANGKYILSGDSDSIYPEGWVDCMIPPLKDSKTSCVYGRYSFIPGNNSSRLLLGLHEICAEFIFRTRKNEDECINVRGVNSAFRKEDALKLGGYEHDLQTHLTGRCEDGWMAYTLMQIGEIRFVGGKDARVWTTDRRLVYDGGVKRAFVKRFKKEVGRMSDNLISKKA